MDDMIVKVLGTSFNINAYKDQGNILTTLVSGKVDIQDMSGESLVVMRTNQQVRFSTWEKLACKRWMLRDSCHGLMVNFILMI